MSKVEQESPDDEAPPPTRIAAITDRVQRFALRHRRVVAGVAAGALVGMLITIAVQPSPTASREYRALVFELADADERAEQMEEDFAELRSELSDYRGRELAVERVSDGLDTRESDLDGREAALAARESAVGIAEAEKEANTIYGGTLLVGADVQPGRYRSNGGETCYWERLRGVSGDFNEIIANGLSEGQVIVEISAGDVAFKSQGCGSWTRI